MKADAIQEIALPYPDILESLLDLDCGGARVTGWRAWVRHADGRIAHSRQPLGCEVATTVHADVAIARCVASIEDAHRRWLARPEEPGAALLFCISYLPPIGALD